VITEKIEIPFTNSQSGSSLNLVDVDANGEGLGLSGESGEMGDGEERGGDSGGAVGGEGGELQQQQQQQQEGASVSAEGGSSEQVAAAAVNGENPDGSIEGQTQAQQQQQQDGGVDAPTGDGSTSVDGVSAPGENAEGQTQPSTNETGEGEQATEGVAQSTENTAVDEQPPADGVNNNNNTNNNNAEGTDNLSDTSSTRPQTVDPESSIINNTNAPPTATGTTNTKSKQPREPLYYIKETYKLNMCVQSLPEKVAEVNSIYFLKNVPGPVPMPKSSTDAEHSLPKVFEVGYFSGHALLMLEQTIMEVYLPLLNTYDFSPEGAGASSLGPDSKQDGHHAVSGGSGGGGLAGASNNGSGEKSSVKDMNLKSEFVISMQKFASHIAHTAQQVAGDTRLKIPDELMSLQGGDVNELSKNLVVVRGLEKLAEEWIETILGVLGREGRKVPVGNVSRSNHFFFFFFWR
jgi:hypothetical protein